ncbi:hypothetical protein GQF56_01830 [Rhodobacter sphaeroides]|jgi:hypothetical protein|uniref:Uncharacterized protein n=2 Tax=Cereibacter sphaeroides TaxID=1063 RepID=U5NRK6_CERS4|nr:hypothetical protein [Cereibacter sphaeroides]EKX58156.1 hypothetical protein D516_0638 [Rhodobacter sp. AKP1]AGY32445.1 hypothetical protein RSP_7575 [Cereibacter sphaeroides 2.4.1]AXC62461.1 hypothetical protein DQL45_14165 [Cereibacter sphaeroides 2.4.1]AZB62494.1 hypothetical protein EBL87_01650 [Cereibacter sphaeroides]AZB69556.1 hypothetical protein EBL86_14775 [Cereibacter sphaeroides]
MRLLFDDDERAGFRLVWPFVLRLSRRPAANLKTPKILTREELKELFSLELSQSATGTEQRPRPVGMSPRSRFSA